MSDSAKHAVLLDALEAAGFPRSALVGAGNSFHLSAPAHGGVTRVTFDVRREHDDAADQMTLRLARVNEVHGHTTANTGYQISKKEARQLGAFLLSFGYSP